MRALLIACLILASFGSCTNSTDAPRQSAGTGPRETIADLSQALRDRDFAAFADLHTEECYEEEARAWKRTHEEVLADPDRLRQEAQRLGVSEADVRRMTWRDALAAILRNQLAADPDWTAHLEDLTVLDERTEGDSSRVTVRYGEPKSDEIHELLLLRRDGRWLVREWD